jgi:alkylresorcinol/alkylpyrone synthase
VCSATFVHGDRSKSNLIATALFGDGAAACVLAPVRADEDAGLRVLGSHTHLIDNSDAVMGWTLEAEGLRVRFARSIPDIVRTTVPGFHRATAEAAGIDVAQIEHYVLHPGGARVLAAYEAALAVPRARIETAYQVLRAHGNMSSPTVLFVLDRFMRETPRTGAAGLVLGLGPGFAAEGVVFRW